jgi:hypothetical protein
LCSLLMWRPLEVLFFINIALLSKWASWCIFFLTELFIQRHSDIFFSPVPYISLLMAFVGLSFIKQKMIWLLSVAVYLVLYLIIHV